MKKSKSRLMVTLCMLALLGLFNPIQAAESELKRPDIIGDWVTEDGKSIVRIEEVNGSFVGKIIWLADPLFAADDPDAGKPKYDRLNEDPQLSKRPIIGLPVLQGFSDFNERKGEYTRGTVYDPENGKTYKGYLRFDGKNRLKMKGYIGVRLAGRSSYWTRRTADDPGPAEEKK